MGVRVRVGGDAFGRVEPLADRDFGREVSFGFKRKDREDRKDGEKSLTADDSTILCERGRFSVR